MMTYDWQDTLLGEGDLARRAAAMVPRMLAHPAVTLDQVSQLRGHIDDCIGRLGTLLVEMENAGADQVFVGAARTIRDAWQSLAHKAAERSRLFEIGFVDVRPTLTDTKDQGVATH
ncbi:hypothetical protein J2Z31_003090 [Sinorhizobium kostiense]|uniref:Uncharacterized protein n=1 Tax=Sinorhizobium kostiense TaxID=76747 RepID=A0ABS4R2H0_9HYPH|nr:MULTISPECIES: hypothetical protein [Sinorhizobium]MBP2236576.1 hypothetical protein [Sinorhizobium kostiense]